MVEEKEGKLKRKLGNYLALGKKRGNLQQYFKKIGSPEGGSRKRGKAPQNWDCNGSSCSGLKLFLFP